jgi:anti-sigma factor RsiW
LDYAPQVLDLATDGFVLVGGRTDSVNSQPSATLVYGAKKHFITVFERPSDRRVVLTLAQQRGFNMAHWSDGAMDIWAVSDLEAGELERFGRAWTQSVAQSTTKS